MNKLMISTLVAAGIATAAPLAMAQTGNLPTGVHQNQRASGHHHGNQAFSLPGERVEAQLAYIRTALKITDAQQAQWDDFAGVMRKHAQNADERIKAWRAKSAKPEERRHQTVIERLEHRQARLASAVAQMTERLAVEKPLYSALSPEQQQIADQVLASRQHGGFHRGDRHGKT